MKKIIIISLLFSHPLVVLSQSVEYYSYYDPEKKMVYEKYHLLNNDPTHMVFHGPYESYYRNGNIKSTGTLNHNKATGLWKFYYPSGTIKMKGPYENNINHGMWTFYHENGTKSMEGYLDNNLRDGNWIYYDKRGRIKEKGLYKKNQRHGMWTTYDSSGNITHKIDHSYHQGKITEYYKSGKKKAEGFCIGIQKTGHWKIYHPDGNLESEGDYKNNLKYGLWTFYSLTGEVYSRGNYKNDKKDGEWFYYYSDSKVGSKGNYKEGVKDGHWKSVSPIGSVLSETFYTRGSGNYLEYYPSGKIKVSGCIKNGLDEGRWFYYYEDGKLEGECNFSQGKGSYQGYYRNGTLMTRGEIDQDVRVGTWELYENNNDLSGYYKHYHQEDTLFDNLTSKLIHKSKTPKHRIHNQSFFKRMILYYFTSTYGEYKGAIFSMNPLFLFMHQLPLHLEFYSGGKIGYDVSVDIIRYSFFKSKHLIAEDKLYERGYAAAFKQKFYVPLRIGLVYFAHELRAVNMNHHLNKKDQGTLGLITYHATENRIMYGPQIGFRYMKSNNQDGYTADIFVGYSVGQRSLHFPVSNPLPREYLNANKRVGEFRFGINFGFCTSFSSRK